MKMPMRIPREMILSWAASLVVVLASLSGSSALARGFGGYGIEDSFMVSNGQGVSSPSFWGGLKAENPAGVSYNQRLKLQSAVAAFSDSTSNLRGSGGVLVGLGPVGAGLEWTQFDSSPYAASNSAIQWGLATDLDAMHLRIGVSGHHLKSSSGSYTLGMIYEPFRILRVGFMVPAAQNGIHDLAGGLSLELDPAIDLVVDASMNAAQAAGVVKPGITLRGEHFQVSGGYGYRYRGSVDPVLSSKLSAAIGFKITDHVLIEYNYKGLPQHLLSLTLR
jgi:hypothetical protein